MMEARPALSAAMSRVFRAAATTLIMPASPVDASTWAEIEAIVAMALAQRPALVQRQFIVFLAIVQNGSLLRFGRRFTALDDERRTRFLAALERSPILLLRRGVWGLRTVAFLGYYGRSATAAEIGYGATREGWGARPADGKRR